MLPRLRMRLRGALAAAALMQLVLPVLSLPRRLRLRQLQLIWLAAQGLARADVRLLAQLVPPAFFRLPLLRPIWLV